MSGLRSLTLLLALACVAAAPSRAVEPVLHSDIRQNLFSVCFSDTGEAWIVGELGRIYHTNDGGRTFLRSRTGSRDPLLSVACLPDRTVVAVGANGVAIRSADGGQTWQAASTGTKRNLLGVAFADRHVGIAVGDYGTILRTEDGGATWRPGVLPPTIPLPEDVAEIVDPGDVLLYDAAFIGPERAWIVGEFGVLLTSSDGGRTWTARRSPVETTLFGVGFSDESNGWAVGIEEVMLHTRDGGETWGRQEVPARRGFVLALYDVAVRGQNGWAIGDNGFLLRTTDGGVSWQRVELPIELAGNWLRGIALNPGSEDMVVGSDGLVLVRNGEAFRRAGPES